MIHPGVSIVVYALPLLSWYSHGTSIGFFMVLSRFFHGKLHGAFMGLPWCASMVFAWFVHGGVFAPIASIEHFRASMVVLLWWCFYDGVYASMVLFGASMELPYETFTMLPR